MAALQMFYEAGATVARKLHTAGAKCRMVKSDTDFGRRWKESCEKVMYEKIIIPGSSKWLNLRIF